MGEITPKNERFQGSHGILKAYAKHTKKNEKRS